jgi:hypothetical protein
MGKICVTKDPHYFSEYFLKKHPVKHHGRCKSGMCVSQRETARVSPRDMYRCGKWGVCNECETPYPAQHTRCPCCSHILRKRSKYRKKREDQVARY